MFYIGSERRSTLKLKDVLGKLADPSVVNLQQFLEASVWQAAALRRVWPRATPPYLRPAPGGVRIHGDKITARFTYMLHDLGERHYSGVVVEVTENGTTTTDHPKTPLTRSLRLIFVDSVGPGNIGPLLERQNLTKPGASDSKCHLEEHAAVDCSYSIMASVRLLGEEGSTIVGSRSAVLSTLAMHKDELLQPMIQSGLGGCGKRTVALLDEVWENNFEEIAGKEFEMAALVRFADKFMLGQLQETVNSFPHIYEMETRDDLAEKGFQWVHALRPVGSAGTTTEGSITSQAGEPSGTSKTPHAAAEEPSDADKLKTIIKSRASKQLKDIRIWSHDRKMGHDPIWQMWMGSSGIVNTVWPLLGFTKGVPTTTWSGDIIYRQTLTASSKSLSWAQATRGPSPTKTPGYFDLDLSSSTTEAVADEEALAKAQTAIDDWEALLDYLKREVKFFGVYLAGDERHIVSHGLKIKEYGGEASWFEHHKKGYGEGFRPLSVMGGGFSVGMFGFMVLRPLIYLALRVVSFLEPERWTVRSLVAYPVGINDALLIDSDYGDVSYVTDYLLKKPSGVSAKFVEFSGKRADIRGTSEFWRAVAAALRKKSQPCFLCKQRAGRLPTTPEDAVKAILHALDPNRVS